MTKIGDQLKGFAKDVKDVSSSAGEKISKAGKQISKSAKSSAKFAKESAGTIATTLLDQNGDGKFDQEDVKILTKKGKKLAKKASDEICSIAKETKNSDLLKEAAAGAAVGAVIAIPLPLVGPVAGATVGAAIGTYAQVMKSMNKKR